MEAGVGIIKALLRLFSCFFEGLLALVLLVISLLSIVTGAELNLGFLPWKGMALSHWLLALALIGLITLLMALAGKLRWLFFLWCLAVFVLLVVMTLFSIVFERKIVAYMQARKGPNRVGPRGYLQSLADGLKLALKEEIIPALADKPVYFLAPVFSAVPAFLAFSVIPFGPMVSIFGRSMGGAAKLHGVITPLALAATRKSPAVQP